MRPRCANEGRRQSRQGWYLSLPCEGLVSALERLDRRQVFRLARQQQTRTVQRLQSVFEHRAIDFRKHVPSNLDHIVGPHAHDAVIEGCVVNFAQRQTV